MAKTTDFTNFANERPNYFPGQFLLEDDFELQHKYLSDRQSYHNQSLHISGILEGLEVIADKKAVLVKSGSAINSKGELIVVKIDIPFSDFKNLANGELYIQYSSAQNPKTQQQTDIPDSYTRWIENPTLGFGTTPENSVKLAKLTIADSGITVDNNIREYSGLSLPNPNSKALTLRSGGNANPNLAVLTGSLKLDADITIQGKIQPSVGNSENNGIMFPKDPGGGGGDAAWIRYYSRNPNSTDLGLKEQTTLEIGTSNDPQDHIALMTAGGVGIGTNNPVAKLDITATTRTGTTHPTAVKGLYVTGDFLNDSDGIEFRHTNGTQGIGFGFNTIYAAGSNVDQDLGLKAKGAGKVIISKGSLTIQDGKVNLTGNQQIVFTDVDLTNNLKLQLYTGYGLGVNSSTLFYTANGNHSWRDTQNIERMLLTTGADGGLAVKGTGTSSFAGSLTVNGNLTINIPGGAGAWNKFVVNTTTEWGDGATQYVTIGSGGASGIMLSNPHITWRDSRASIRYGRSGGIQTGSYWDAGVREDGSFSFSLDGVSDNKLAIAKNGNVFIQGAIQPSAGSAETNGIMFPKDPGGGTGDAAWIRYYSRNPISTDPALKEQTTLEIGISNDPQDHIALITAGGVGIGTNNPTRGKLHIEGFVSYGNPSGYRYLRRDGVFDNTGVFNAPYSLYASSFIGAQEFNAFSDLRIKEIKGNSDSQADLQTLLQIQVTDYSYKDKIAHGDSPRKKVIGQQIATVYPQAVSTHTDTVPDILQFAVIAENWVTLNNHNLKIGDKVKILWDDHKTELFLVEAIKADSFKISLNYTGDVFVYGREVDDFHVVDYDALSMLHISATQELYKIIKKLERDISEKIKVQNPMSDFS